ncbi:MULTISPECIES: hypothetical protein [Deinococcus]|uniref:Glycoside hydrolase family 38 N-terminal domain-containing protein n=1 Tax=Deinococcus rufus TaxID=2136097 RepID=A0ABV7ZAD5_9DEIO|nr:hypothetical protein [Deinococcus sp. AB2017081]WQE97310.1 hypothetical protein U2P90_19585 [Deinococcus sp. AB2017081]
MVKEIWLIHHSHTDIGFTHPQPIVFELHRRYIDDVLDLIDRHRDRPDDARFRWTVEMAGIAWDWWRHAPPRQRERFLAAGRAGLLDVGAFRWNMTPLADHGVFADQFREAELLRAEGLTIRSAMQCDVDGLPWGAVQLMRDHGIDGFTMAINEHFGRAVSPRPGAFHWAAPDGGTVLAWNGPHYHSTPNRAMRIGGPVDEAIPATDRYLAALHAYGYALDVFGVQPTNLYFSDNDLPDAGLPDFVEAWNATGHPVRMRLATVTQYLDRLRQEPPERITTQRGDWTDWWNFGAGSTARETRLHLQGQRDLTTAHQVQAWTPAPPRFAALAQDATDQLTLYAEHTWGADWSAASADSDETAIQLSHKLEYAYKGATLARYLKRDALHALAQHLPGDGPCLLAYNPLAHPVTTMLRVPVNAARYADNAYHLAQRFDVEWNGRKGQERWVGPVTLPGAGYAILPLHADGDVAATVPTPPTGLGAVSPDDALRAVPEAVKLSEREITNGLVTLQLDDRGGLGSVRVGGREWSRAGQALGQVVLESPAQERRSAIFGPPQWDAFDMHGAWHPEWEAVRQPGAVLESAASQQPGAAELTQHLQFERGERATAVYRLHPGENLVHMDVTLHLLPDSRPRSYYLHLPLGLDDAAVTHFETAGAVVEFDREQLPGSSRHYVTTLDWLRMQDDHAGVTIGTPDAPLWQIGGYTFGRFDGTGPAPHPQATLNAWLTNNYWDTNFKADQAGELRFTFTLAFHGAEPVVASAARAPQLISRPEIHVFDAVPSRPGLPDTLVALDLGGVRLTRLSRPRADQLSLQVFNPGDDDATVTLGSGWAVPTAVVRRSLAGHAEADGTAQDTHVAAVVPARRWCVLDVSLDPSGTA